MMYEQIKSLRIQAMKDKNSVFRYAYEAVLTECDTLRGRGVEITDEKVIDIVKKEIKKYQDMDGRQVEIAILTKLLPEQLQYNDLVSIYEDSYDIIPKGQPKEFMMLLDEKLGYAGRYDRGMAAKIVMNSIHGKKADK